jgi:hypothetical protein
MIATARNKNELIEGLKKEKDFAVVAVHTGPGTTVAKELAKLGTRPISVIVTSPKWRCEQEFCQWSTAEAGHTAVCAVVQA